MAAQPTVLRPLGGYEQFSAARHFLGLYRSLVTVCRVALPPSVQGAAAAKARLLRALAVVVAERLPALRVGIAGEGTKKPVFVGLSSLDLAAHVEWVDVDGESAADADAEESLRADLQAQTVRAWPDVATHAPWRLRVRLAAAAGWADVCFAVHHALGDGKSGVAFHTHLLEVLNSQAAGGTPDAVDTALTFDDPPALVPPQEAIVAFSYSWAYFVRTLWDNLGPARLRGLWGAAKAAPAAAAYTGPLVSLDPPLQGGGLRLVHVAPAHAAALLAGCRAHGTTLTALLHGLLLVLFARRVPAATAATFSCVMAVSMRPYVGEASLAALRADGVDLDRSMANLVTAFDYTFAPDVAAEAREVQADPSADDDKVWRAAAAVGGDFRARRTTFAQDNIAGLAGWIGDWQQYWLDKAGRPREATWSVSNVGSMGAAQPTPDSAAAADTADTWTPTRCFFVQSSMGKDALLSLGVGGVRGGTLSLSVAWPAAAIDDAVAAGLARDLDACLARYGATGRFAVPNRLGGEADGQQATGQSGR